MLFDHPLRAQVEAEIKAEKEAKALKKKKSAKKPAAETPRKKHPSPETVKKQLSKVEKQERLEAESIAQNALHAETQERLDTLFSDEEKAPDEVASDNATLDEATPTEATPSLESPLSEEEAAIRETQEKASEKWVHSPLDETGAEYENVATEETLEGQALTASDAPTVEQLKKGGEDTIVRHPLTFDKETDEVDAMAVLEALDALYSGESLISEDAKHRNARYSGEGLYTPEPPEEEEEEEAGAKDEKGAKENAPVSNKELALQAALEAKYNLAKSFVGIGALNEALELLDEVRRRGTPEQRERAAELAATIPIASSKDKA